MEIEHESMSDVFQKYHLKDFPFDAVIHKFTEPDTVYPHDHPFGFYTFVLKGSYKETVYDIKHGKVTERHQTWHKGTSHFVPANLIHNITKLHEGECWTIIIPNHKEQEPAFYNFDNGKILKRFWFEDEFKEIS